MARKKNKQRFGMIAVVSGIILMLFSLIAFFSINNGFITEVHSEIFGVGAALFVIGILYLIFKIKVG